MSLDTPYPLELLLDHIYCQVSFFFVLYISNPHFEILVFTFVSMIPTFVVFTDCIVLDKLIVPMENNFGFVTKMISSSSSVMPF